MVEGIFYCSIDDNELANLKILSDEIFGKNHFIGNIAWESKTKSQNTKDSYNKLQPKIEYILCYAKQEKPRFNLEILGQKEYPLIDNEGNNYRIQKAEQDSLDRPHAAKSMVYDIMGVLPKEGKCWKFGIDKKNNYEKNNRIFLKDNFPHIIFYPEDENKDKTKPYWAFIPKEEGTAETGKKELSHILNHNMDTIKPVNVIKKLIFHSTFKKSIVLDYFSGSGTTIEAMMELNNSENGKREIVSIEIGEHFDNIILPRVKKKLFSQQWKNQEPQSKNGISGLFKYYSLEQYEQILRNLKYTDVPDEWLENLKTEDIKDCFLFNDKLSDAIDTTGDKYKIDISKLYENIDLKETIHNLVGKRPAKISDDTVSFKDGSSYPLMQILKPLLVW